MHELNKIFKMLYSIYSIKKLLVCSLTLHKERTNQTESETNETPLLHFTHSRDNLVGKLPSKFIKSRDI